MASHLKFPYLQNSPSLAIPFEESLVHPMRFLLVFVSCCGVPSNGGDGNVSNVMEVPERKVPAGWEETRSLVLPAKRYIRKKRGRVGSSKKAAAAEWKPSLCVISEDNVVVAAERGGAVVESEQPPPKRMDVGHGYGSRARKARVLNNYEDCRRNNPLQMAIPVFSPTPIMF